VSGDGRLADVAVAVLLGGASTRMGADKARIELEGVPSAVRLARLAAELFEEVLLVGGTPPAGAPGRAVADPAGEPSALRGLVGALAAAAAPRVLVVATDLPLVTPDLLLALVAYPDADVVVPRSAAGFEPLCALYRREAVLPLARARLARGELSLHGLLDELAPAVLGGAQLAAVDPDGTALLNANTPEDLARARALLAARRPGHGALRAPRAAGSDGASPLAETAPLGEDARAARGEPA
jgi:molybdopterin-guanine dinucleotide biosynthesis protein A